MARRLLAVVACYALLSVTAVAQGYRVPGFPTYVSNVTLCVKRDNILGDIFGWRCQTFSQRWETRGTCYVSEWMIVRMLAADANARGFHMGARVECIAEYEA